MSWVALQFNRIYDQLSRIRDTANKAKDLAQQALTATSQASGGGSTAGLGVRYARTQTGGIPAYSGGPGSATVNETDATGTTTGATFTAYNFGSNVTGATAGTRIACTMDGAGHYFCFWEDCG